MPGMHSMNHRRFTLIELLVVVAIIAVLAGLLLPALNSARARARETACMSQMRQIAFAMLMYEGDNSDEALLIYDATRTGGRFTWNDGGIHGWPDTLMDGDYLGNEAIFLSPAVSKRRDRKISYQVNWWSWLHVKADGTVDNGTADSFRAPGNRVSAIPDPQGRIQMVEGGIWYQNPADYWYGSEAFVGEAAMGLSAYQNLTRYPHSDDTRTHVLFADKHIAIVPHTVDWLHSGPGVGGNSSIGWPLGRSHGSPVQGY